MRLEHGAEPRAHSEKINNIFDRINRINMIFFAFPDERQK
jgi:hypothetical protein